MPEEFTEPKTFSNFHKLKRQCLDEMRFLVNYFSGAPTPHFQWEFLRRSLQSLIRLRAAARLAAESAAPHFLDPFQELVKLLIAQSIDIAIPVLKVEFDHPTVFVFLRSKRLEQKYTVTLPSKAALSFDPPTHRPPGRLLKGLAIGPVRTQVPSCSAALRNVERKSWKTVFFAEP
jgi:hypothetical protein